MVGWSLGRGVVWGRIRVLWVYETGSNHLEDWGTRSVITLVGYGDPFLRLITDHLVDVNLVCRSLREGSYVVRGPC